jgi:hypothetical protein
VKLSANRVAEFHSELELLSPADADDVYVSFAVELEQRLMEGVYNKVRSATRHFLFVFIFVVVFVVVKVGTVNTNHYTYTCERKSHFGSLHTYHTGVCSEERVADAAVCTLSRAAGWVSLAAND